MKKDQYISYGIGKEYLPDWGVQEALREVYQNFLDYGEYKEEVVTDSDYTTLILTSSYDFDDLSILKLGRSIKGEGARGKHGEGLKMAMLVLARLNLIINIRTKNLFIFPMFKENKVIGEVFNIVIRTLEDGASITNSCTTITIPTEDYLKFKEHFILPEDIIFSENYHGDKLNKPVGQIYAGGLYVCTEENLQGSYNISPDKLHLDRDRRIPSSFSVSYHSSKINEAQAKFDWKDTSYDDYKHVKVVPPALKKDVKVREFAGKVEFVAVAVNKESGLVEEIQIQNQSIIQSFLADNYFTRAISKIKETLLTKVGLKDLLLDFRKKYCTTVEAKRDFDIILAKMGIRMAQSS